MKRRLFWDKFFEKLLAGSAWVSVLTLAGIFLMLFFNSVRAFQTISLS